MKINNRPIYQKGGNLIHKPARQAAQTARCTIRAAGCQCGQGNVVLCHIRRFGWAGTGHKPADYKAVFGCNNCHQILDGPRSDERISDTDIMRAWGETLDIQFANGVFKI